MTSEQWAGLHEKARWDIVVALRGPDCYFGETVKWFTSAVIRRQVEEIFHSHGLVNSDLNLVVLPRGDLPEVFYSADWKKTRTGAWNYDHFCSHIQSAAQWLNLPVLSVEAAVWYEAMQIKSASKAGARILLAAKEWKEKMTRVEQDTLPSRYDPYTTFYSDTEIKELSRHLEKGVRF